MLPRFSEQRHICKEPPRDNRKLIHLSDKSLIFNVLTYHFPSQNDSSVNIEVVLPNANPRMFIMVYQPRLPTLTNYSRFTFIKDLPVVNGNRRDFEIISQKLGAIIA